MKRSFSAILLVGLLALVGSTPPPAPEAPTPADASGCDVTIQGQHGGAAGRITVDFSLSEVRNRVGWWRSLGVGSEGHDRISVAPGGRLSEVFSLDFGCNAQRRYRLYLSADVDGQHYEYVRYYPSDDAFTRETVIDLGDLSRFFDAIEPGPPVTPPPADPLPGSPPGSVAGLDLDGEWIRRESNNDPNDGMRILVSGGQAVLTLVPETASSNWHEGEVLWQNIEPDGALEVLGSNDRYYSAQMTTEGDDRLHIDIDANGRGNDQTWERGVRVLSGEIDLGGAGEEPVFENVEIAEACADQLRLDAGTAAIVDPIVEELMTEQEIVGVAVGVVQNGEVTYLKGHGYADRENETPVTWETLFRWASVSKTLTAVAALSLWEDGDLLLNEDIRTYVSEYPTQPEGTLTPFMTLSNTSGVRHYDSLDVINHPHRTRAASFSRELPYDPVDAVGIFDDASLIAPVMSPPFAPGRLYHYSTFGFILAGAAVERAAEEAVDLSYTELVQDRIADPLCMDSLQPDEPGRQSDHETRRYRKDRNNVIYRLDDDDRADDENILWKLPGGGYQSNIRDLALFARGLMEREILDDATHLLQETVVRGVYGLGIYNQTNDHDNNNATRETRRIGHGGDAGSSGVRASMYFYPDHDLGIVLLTNSSQAARGRILSRLANALGAPWSNSDYRLTSSLSCGQTTQTGSGTRFAGVWQEGPTGQLLRRGYPTGAFGRERERLRAQGYHLTDLDTFLDDGERLWDGVFTPGIPRTRLHRNFETQPFLQTVTDERGNGFRLVDVEVYFGSQGQLLWGGVFAQAPERHDLEFGLNTSEFHDIRERRKADGFQLVDIETYVATNGVRLWAGVFVEGGGEDGLLRNVAPEDVEDSKGDFARRGLRVIDFEHYFDSRGQPLWALVAHPLDGNQTSRVDRTFCGTWDGPFTGLWETHEDQARQGRSLVDFERYPVPVD